MKRKRNEKKMPQSLIQFSTLQRKKKKEQWTGKIMLIPSNSVIMIRPHRFGPQQIVHNIFISRAKGWQCLYMLNAKQR